MRADFAIAQIIIGTLIAVGALIAGFFMRRRGKRMRNFKLRMQAYILWVVGGLLAVVLCFPAIAYLYTEHLWFKSVRYEDVFWNLLKTRWSVLFKFAAVAFGFMALNVFIGSRVCKVSGGVSRWTRELTGQFYYTLLISILLLSLLLAVPMMFLWDDFLRYENGASTGIAVPDFERELAWNFFPFPKDLGFYLFSFPVYRWASLWLKGLLWVTAIVVAVMYNGYHRRNAGMRGRVQHYFIVHGSVLWLMLLGASLWRSQTSIWNVLYTSRTPWGLGRVDGMGYVDNALIGTTHIYMLCLIGVGVVVVINMFWHKRMVWFSAFAIWGLGYILLIQVYPVFVYWTEVRQTREASEAPFLKSHIESTRRAFGLNQIEERDQIRGVASIEMVKRNIEVKENIQLWDRRVAYEVLKDKQIIKPYYQFHPYTDVDRYWIDGKYWQVLSAVREVNPAGVPEAQYWEVPKMVYTHGYGVCVIPVNQFTKEGGNPNFWVHQIPIKYLEELAVTQPQIYYGELTQNYAIVNTKKQVLFFIESRIVRDLDNVIFSERLRAVCEANGITPSKNVTVSIRERSKRWQVRDPDNDQKYTVSKREGKLNVANGQKEELFSIDLETEIELEFQEHLDSEILSENLRGLFEADDVEFTTVFSIKDETRRDVRPNVKVSVEEEGVRWLIIDKGNEQKYVVRKENGRLEVYKNKEVDPEGKIYEGAGGVQIDNWFKRLCFATRFDFWRILLSKDITQESKILFWRKIGTRKPLSTKTVADRVSHIAPFLKYDPDPYIVIGDDGQLWWIIDIYVTSRSYPNAKTYIDRTRLIENPLYSEPTFDRFNYVRNPAVAVVNAYSGEVSFYFTKGETALFSIQLEADMEFDDANLLTRLRETFENRQITLSDNLTLSVKQAGKEWLMTDQDYGWEYTVTKTEGKLNIYTTEPISAAYKRAFPNLFKSGLPFNINLKFENNLTAGVVPVDLRQKFENEDIPLSENATVSAQKRKGRWVLTDVDNQEIYHINKDMGQLGIYQAGFGIQLEGNTDLNDGNLLTELRRAFEEHHITLSDTPTILIKEAGKEWLVDDQDYRQKYTVTKAEKQLTIYAVEPISVTYKEAVPNLFEGIKVDPEFESELNNGVVPGKLRKKFENTQIPLSQNATVSARTRTGRWLLTDEDNQKIYHINKGREQLSIYQIPAGLHEHLRYPDYLTRIQAEMYAEYHVQNANTFFKGADRWHIPDEVYYTELQQMVPYYAILKLPGEEKTEGLKLPGEEQPEFVNMIPFTPPSRVKLINAWLVARCDAEHYGQLIVYRLPKDESISGPKQIEEDIENALANEIWFKASKDNKDTQVIRGNLLVIPVEDTLFYVEPIYLKPKDSNRAQLKVVCVVAGDQFAFAETFGQALVKIFGAGIGVGDLGPAKSEKDLAIQAMEKFEEYMQLIREGKERKASTVLRDLGEILARLIKLKEETPG